MLDLIAKIENLFNMFVAKFTALIIFIAHKILPRSFFRKLDDLQYQVVYKYAQSKKKLRQKGKELLESTIENKDKLFVKFKAAQEYQFKEKIKTKIQAVKSYIFDTPIKQHLKQLFNFIKSIALKLIFPLKRFNSAQIGLAAVTLMIVGLSATIIYQNGTFIWNKENPYRAPASIEVFEKRPEYYKRGDRTMVVRNVKIPLYIEDIKQVKSILIEFGVRTTTRFAKIYLEHYDYKLRDQIFMTMEPVLSSFPLEEEGKDVLKEKLQNEINVFLKKENVEGEVEAIKILYIIAH